MHASRAELLEDLKPGLLWVTRDGVARDANAAAGARTGLATRVELPIGAPHRQEHTELDIAQAQIYARDLAALMTRSRKRLTADKADKADKAHAQAAH